MSEDARIALVDFLAKLGVSENELRRRIEGGLPVQLVRDHFQAFLKNRNAGLYAGKAFFESDDFERLRRAVLSVPPDVDYDEYWIRSGRATADLLSRKLGLNASSRVLDFGCGVGRVAKAVIEAVGCTVIGVDISESMRASAERYVGSPLFSSVSSEDFHAGAVAPGSITAAYCSIVLQHCRDPEAELRVIRAACAPGARLLVINARRRFVPTPVGWQDDGIDILALLSALFTLEEEIDLAQVPDLRFKPDEPLSALQANHFAVVLSVSP